MTRSRLLRAILVVNLAAAGCGGGAGGLAPAPADGCCRELVAVLEASILKIDVMRVRLRVDDATASALQALVGSAPRSPALEDRVSAIYLDSRSASVDTEFLMGMSGGMFLDNTTKAFRGMASDSLLGGAEAETLSAEARSRFAFLTAAGVKPADRLRYELSGDTVTTSYTRAGQMLMHDKQVGDRYRRALLASYFAPSSDFRRGLLDDVFTP